MTIDYARLRALAEAATPGPWIAGDTTDWDGTPQASVNSSNAPITWDDHSGEVFKPEDAEYLAAIDPPTMLALLDRLEELESREPEWEYSIAYPYGDAWETDGVDPFKTYADAEYELARDEYLDKDRVVRRRKAGPWLPVTGDDDA